MKKLFLFPIFLLFSCSSIKVKDFNKDYTQELVSKVKFMEINNYEYKFIKKDTVILAKKTTLNFDFYNNIIYEKIISEFEDSENNYEYQNGLLVKQKPVSDNDTSITTYKYDKSNNLIEEKSFDNKRVFILKTHEYDKFKNVIEKKITYFGKNNFITTIEYDYKKKFMISKTPIDTFKLQNTSKKYFNRKGYIIRSQIFSDYKKYDYDTYEIDRKGNLTKKIFYKADDSIIEVVTYKNTYDKKGNIIIRDRYLNNNLIEKTTYEITYW